MNVRTFLRFQHPAVTLLTTFAFCAGAASFGRMLFGWSGSVPAFFAFATALPLLLGFSIANVAHEPMHRPFFPLLPNGLRRLHRSTAIAVAAFGAIVAGCVTLLDPAISPAASFGLAIALLALPCVERHRHANGLGGRLVAIVLWFALSYTLTDHLRPAMLAQPWAFFVAGVAIAAAALKHAFARRHLRERTGTFFVPPERMLALFYAFDGVTRARIGDEQRRQAQTRTRGARSAGRNWPVRRVGESTREWMRVFLHAVAGWRRGGTYASRQFALIALLTLYAFGLPLFARLMGRLMEKPVTSGYAEMLAQMTGSISSAASGNPALSLTLLGFLPLLHPGIAALMVLLVPQPQLPYPISRERIARVVFALSLLQWGLALAIPGTIIWLASVVGQFASGVHQPALGVEGILATDLLLAFALPLIACGGTFQRALPRIGWWLVVGLGTVAAVFLRDRWLPFALSPAGVALALAASAGAILLLRSMLLRRFRTADLRFEPGLMHSFVA